MNSNIIERENRKKIDIIIDKINKDLKIYVKMYKINEMHFKNSKQKAKK